MEALWPINLLINKCKISKCSESKMMKSKIFVISLSYSFLLYLKHLIYRMSKKIARNNKAFCKNLNNIINCKNKMD